MADPDQGYDIWRLFGMVAPERAEELAALVEKYDTAFLVANDQPRFLLEASPSLGFVRYSKRTLLHVWVLAWAMWKEMYCWSSELWFLANDGKPFVLAELEVLPGQAASYADADGVYAEAVAFARSDPLDWRLWPSEVPKPLDIATASQEDWLIKDFVHHALAFFFLHELRHIILYHDRHAFASEHDEELECDRWAVNVLLARSDSYAGAASEDSIKVKSKRAMGLALGTAVIAHIQELGLWEAGIEHPPIAERMQNLVASLDAPPTDLSWTVACSFLLASLRRRSVVPKRVDFQDHRDLFMKLLATPAEDLGDRARS
jgi:hypothetical protein